MTSASNRAQVLYGPRDLRLTERGIQPPEKDEVQVEIKSTTLCGSDLHYFNYYANGDIKIREPLTQGHEAAGKVVAIGSNVSQLLVGDRVAIEAGIACGHCEQCMDGRYNVCASVRFRSSAVSIPHLQGTLQEKINHPAAWCHLLPGSLSYDEGALLEPLSVAIHAARKCHITKESRCLVIGAGAVGLLCAAVAKYQGCRSIVMTDIAEGRLAFARENGFADDVLLNKSQRANTVMGSLANSENLAKDLIRLVDDPESSIDGFDQVFECTGVEACVQTSVFACRPSGDLLLVGMGTPIQTLPMAVVGRKEIRITGIWRYADTYPEALAMMAAVQKDSRLPDLRKLMTHRFSGLDSVPDAFAMASRTEDDAGQLVIKVVVQNGS